jgi:hypothetical protein
MWWWTAGIGLLVFAWICLWRPMRGLSREVQFTKAKKFFHTQRERLEAKFIILASRRTKAGGEYPNFHLSENTANPLVQDKPKSPHLTDCTFADGVSYVRNRTTGELSAFVAISVSMDDPNSSAHNSGDAVGNLQLGTAVFRFDRDHWETEGRAILNLSPAEAIQFFRKDVEKVGEEFAHKQ